VEALEVVDGPGLDDVERSEEQKARDEGNLERPAAPRAARDGQQAIGEQLAYDLVDDDQ
jgi:hypothetical protein